MLTRKLPNGFLVNKMRKFNSTSPRRRPTPPTRVEMYAGFWLRSVSNLVSHDLSLRVEDLGVTLAEWVVLRELYESAKRPAMVAARLGLTRGAVSKLAERLVAKNLINRDADTEDGRGQMLSLTDSGRVLVPVLAMRADVNEKEFFGHLDPEKRVLLVATLREIIRRHALRAGPTD